MNRLRSILLASAAFAATIAGSPIRASADTALPTVPATESWRASAPTVKPPRPPQLPTFQRSTLPNGMTIYVASEHTLPLVSFRVVIKGGSGQDPKGKAGLTALTFGMLDEGAGNRDVFAFSDRVADLGAFFGAGAGRDQGSAGISGLRRHAETMLELLSDAVMQPRLADNDFARLKDETLAGLARRRGSPQGLAGEFNPPLLYGPDHPYGRPLGGTIESVRPLTLLDVKAQYVRLFAPRHAALIAVGDISLAQVEALAVKYFGAWTNPGADLRPIPMVQATPRSKVVVVNKPRSPQTITLIGRPLFSVGHPDEIPLRLANAAFGGTFSSRLNMNLREAKGYTYGANSHVLTRTGVGTFFASTALRQNVTTDGLKEIFAELQRLKSRPLTKEEVEDARAGRVLSQTARFERIAASASAAADLFVYDLPLDYFAQLPKQYESATRARIQQAAAEYFRPSLMRILLVGDAKAIVPELKSAGFGDIEVVEAPAVQL